MNTRTTGRLSGPATSAWTNSTPWSMAACSASRRTRSFTDLESMTVAQTSVCGLDPKLTHRLKSVPLYRPKEKVGENPPDNASEDPSKMGDYTRRKGRKQGEGWSGTDAVWKGRTGVPPVKSRARCACHNQTASVPRARWGYRASLQSDKIIERRLGMTDYY